MRSWTWAHLHWMVSGDPFFFTDDHTTWPFCFLICTLLYMCCLDLVTSLPMCIFFNSDINSLRWEDVWQCVYLSQESEILEMEVAVQMCMRLQKLPMFIRMSFFTCSWLICPLQHRSWPLMFPVTKGQQGNKKHVCDWWFRLLMSEFATSYKVRVSATLSPARVFNYKFQHECRRS